LFIPTATVPLETATAAPSAVELAAPVAPAVPTVAEAVAVVDFLKIKIIPIKMF